ncbi:MAG: hypothetical protein AAGC93_24935 [Cyanobacteria bacterium P01_F01_bin.53]
MDYLLADDDEVVSDGGLQLWIESVPDRFGGNGHKTSQFSIRVTNSLTLASVSFVSNIGWVGIACVADKGIRKRMPSR